MSYSGKMTLRSSKQIRVSVLVLFLTLSAVVVKCDKYSKDSQQRGSCTGGFCASKDEYDEPCIDEGRKGDHGGIGDEPTDDDKEEEPEDEPEEFDYPKEGLYRWDPVKVSYV